MLKMDHWCCSAHQHSVNMKRLRSKQQYQTKMSRSLRESNLARSEKLTIPEITSMKPRHCTSRTRTLSLKNRGNLWMHSQSFQKFRNRLVKVLIKELLTQFKLWMEWKSRKRNEWPTNQTNENSLRCSLLGSLKFCELVETFRDEEQAGNWTNHQVAVLVLWSTNLGPWGLLWQSLQNLLVG